MKKLIFLLVLVVSATGSFGQEKWDIGLFAGKTSYLGDLQQPVFTFAYGRPSGGMLLRYELSAHLNLRSNLHLGALVGDDANYSANELRAASFETTFVEMTLLAEYDLFETGIKGKGSFFERFTPYVFAGAGFSLINNEVEFGNSSPEASADKSAQYSDVQPIVPTGLGFKYNVAKNWTIGAELGMHVSFTDYLDGVSKSGNPDNNDHYLSWGIQAAYRIGNTDADLDGIADKKDKCPNLPGPAKYDGCPDSDGDGITDAEDECPNDAGRALLKGCPDSDNDGVSDFVDDCPDDPGIRRLGGCPDTDNDGIVDPEDNCPTQAGIPALNGCPDADRDGITDAKDDCPLDPGPLLLNGCPDSDSDGIADKYDQCPDLPGPSTTNGCPDADSDGDGTIDRKDQCPDLAGPADNAGCPPIEKEDQAVLDFAMANIAFETGSDKLIPSSVDVLDKIVAIMKKYSGYRLHINGHTDNIGDADKNLQLSIDRARACYEYLTAQGLNPTLISYSGHGETQPIAPNDTEEGRSQNRRVEFILTTEK